MSVDAISKVVDDMFVAFSRGDVDGFVKAIAVDVIYEENTEAEPIRGRVAFKDYVSEWINASSDRRLTPVRKLINSNEAVIELHFEATHDKGELYELEPTGKSMVFDYVLWLNFDEGEIRHMKAFYNPLIPMGQIGG